MTSFVPFLPGRDVDVVDRRAHERKPLRANAALVIASRAFEVRTLDISKSGIGIATSINPRTGQTLSLLLAPPDMPRGLARIAMPVVVVNSILTSAEGEFKVGLKFGQLSRDAVDVVRMYLLAQSSRFALSSESPPGS